MPSKTQTKKSQPKPATVFSKTLSFIRRPSVAVFIIGMLFVLVNVILIDRIRAYSSDDVAWQNLLLTWKPHTGHIAYLGSDPFIVKLPFFMLLNFLFKPARGLLLVSSLIFAALNFVFYYYALLYFYRLFKIKISYLTLLPVIWLASMGHLFSSLFLNPNLRNFELSLSFVLFMLGAKIYYGELKPLRSKWTILLSLVVCGFIGSLIINDLYFLYYGVVPLMVFMAVLAAINKDVFRKRALIIISGLIVSLTAAKIIKVLAKHLGMNFIKSGGDSLAPLHSLPRKSYATLRSMQMVFNADFWDKPLRSLITLGFFVNAVILVIFTVLALWRSIRSFKNARKLLEAPRTLWQLFFTALFLFVLFLYTVTTASAGTDTYRYLVMLPYIFVPLWALSLSAKRSRFITAGSVITVASIALNFYMTIAYNHVGLKTGGNPNQPNLNLISDLERHGLSRGYGNYWDGNINSYLSDGKIEVLPVSCNADGFVSAFRWLVDSANFNLVPSQKTYLLIDPGRFDLTICPTTKIFAQFGRPTASLELDNHFIYVFNYDIGVKFH